MTYGHLLTLTSRREEVRHKLPAVPSSGEIRKYLGDSDTGAALRPGVMEVSCIT